MFSFLEKKSPNIKQEKPLDNKIPYSFLAKEDIICTKNGHLIAAFELKSMGIETMSDEELYAVKQSLNQVFVSVAQESYAFWFHGIRKKEKIGSKNQSDTKEFESSFYEEYKKKISCRLYENQFFLSVVQKPAISNSGGLLDLSHAVGKKRALDSLEKRAVNFDEYLTLIKSLLSAFSAKRLSLIETEKGPISELMGLYGGLINLRDMQYYLPMQDISGVLAVARPFFGFNRIELKEECSQRHAAIVAVKNYSSATSPGMLGRILGLDQELVVYQYFEPYEKTKSIKVINREANRYFQAQSQARSNLDALDVAVDQIESDRVGFGEHSCAVVCYSSDSEKLDSQVVSVIRELEEIGIKAVRETLNLESAWVAMLPGNISDLNRKSMISTLNLSDLTLFATTPSSHNGKNHLGAPLIDIETSFHTKYHLNFHGNSEGAGLAAGHTLVLGSTGAGKTTLALAVDAASRRLGVKSIIFDYAMACAPYVLACRGKYYQFIPGKPTNINPIPKEDSFKARAYLSDFIFSLVLSPNEIPSTEDEKEVSRVVSRVLESSSYKNFSDMCSLFSVEWKLRPRLEKWLKAHNGRYAFLFDNEGEQLNLDESIVGFDLSHIKDDSQILCSLLTYLFYRIESNLGNGPLSIILDEGWQFLESVRWQKKIKEWLATLRKDNAYVVFATQHPEAIAASPVCDSLMQNTKSKIIFPNNNASEDIYCRKIGLTKREFEIVKEVPISNRYFLHKIENESNLVKLDLKGLDSYLAVFSGNRKRSEVALGLFEENQSDWLDKYISRFCDV